VVPNIEELRAELEIGAAFFIDKEVLEQRNVPVVATGTAHTVMGSFPQVPGAGVENTEVSNHWLTV